GLAGELAGELAGPVRPRPPAATTIYTPNQRPIPLEVSHPHRCAGYRATLDRVGPCPLAGPCLIASPGPLVGPWSGLPWGRRASGVWEEPPASLRAHRRRDALRRSNLLPPPRTRRLILTSPWQIVLLQPSPKWWRR